MRSAQRVRALRGWLWLRWGLSSGMDIAAWLGAEVRVGQKDKVLRSCPSASRMRSRRRGKRTSSRRTTSLRRAQFWTRNRCQLDEDLKIILRAFGDGVKLLKAERFKTDVEKLSLIHI